MKNNEHPQLRIRRILEKERISRADLEEWSRLLSIYNNSICEDYYLQELLQIFAEQTKPEIARIDATLTEEFIKEYLYLKQTFEGDFSEEIGRKLYHLTTKYRLNIGEVERVLKGYHQVVQLQGEFQEIYIKSYNYWIDFFLEKARPEKKLEAIESAMLLALDATEKYMELAKNVKVEYWP